MALQTLNYTQSVPSSTWTITHNFGCVPICDVFVEQNGAIVTVLPMAVKHIDGEVLQVLFSSPRAGSARLVGKHVPPTL